VSHDSVDTGCRREDSIPCPPSHSPTTLPGHQWRSRTIHGTPTHIRPSHGRVAKILQGATPLATRHDSGDGHVGQGTPAVHGEQNETVHWSKRLQRQLHTATWDHRTRHDYIYIYIYNDSCWFPSLSRYSHRAPREGRSLSTAAQQSLQAGGLDSHYRLEGSTVIAGWRARGHYRP
jgi:hypothetical protein